MTALPCSPIVTRWHSTYLSHPLYAPLRPYVPLTDGKDWPAQTDYDHLLEHARAAGCAVPAGLRFVCDLEPQDYYELHIARSGEVPTRTCNWHDWFNALAWLAWPHSKAALNVRHARAIARGEVRRGPLRDAATLLDECGIIVASADPALSTALDDMRWHELFVARRPDWGQRIGVFTLGHALFETGLDPHLGWCGKALVLAVEEEFFDHPYATQLATLDRQLAAALADDTWLVRPRELWPLPLLGIPGWWPDNENAAFYANTDYFRPTRRAKSASVS